MAEAWIGISGWTYGDWRGLAESPARAYLSDAATVDRIGDEIAELAANIHAATYQLLVKLREFDRCEGWGWGFRSCAHWLSWRTGIDLGGWRRHAKNANSTRRASSRCIPTTTACMCCAVGSRQRSACC